MKPVLHILKNEIRCWIPWSMLTSDRGPELWLDELKLLTLPLPLYPADREGTAYFSMPITRRLKRFISHPRSLQLRLADTVVKPVVNEQVIWKQINRLSSGYLADLFDAGWHFTEQGELLNSSNQPLSSMPFALKIKSSSKGYSRFTVTSRGTAAAALAYQNIGIFVDHIKIGLASIQPKSETDSGLKAIFRINTALLHQISKKHELRLLLDNRFYLVPARMLIKLVQQHTASMVADDSYLSKISKGYVLTKYGKLSKPKENNSIWLEHTLSLYQRAQHYFKQKLGYDLYLTGGTLLGYARAGGVISFDKDFDSGYLSKHTDPAAIKAEFKAIILELLQAGEDIRLVTRVGKKFRCDYFMWYDQSGCHIDVFPGAFIDGHYRRPTFVDTLLTAEDFFPMQAAQFNGYDVMVPRNVEKKVAAVYGEGWQTPDPFWKKVKSDAIKAYRKQIMLNQHDFLELAQFSKHEGNMIRELITNDQFEVQL